MRPLLLFFFSLIISVSSVAQLTYFDITTPQRNFQKGITALEINLDEYLLFGWDHSNVATFHVNGFGQIIDSLFLGNTQTSDAIMLKDGTFVLIEGGGTRDWITRYDLQGNQIWGKDLDPEFYNLDSNPRLFNSYDSNFFVLFKHECLTLCKAKLALVNYNGDSILGLEINHFVGDLIQTQDSGFIIAGGETWTTYGDDVIITRLDANFDTVWTRSYDFGGDMVAATECKVLANGEIIIGGRIDRNNPAMFPGMFLLRISETGDSLWSWSHIEQNHQWDMNGIQSTNDGGFVYSYYRHLTHFSNAYRSVGLRKLDGSGNQIWDREYVNIRSDDTRRPVIKTSNGSFLLSGTYSTHWLSYEGGRFLKIDSTGTIISELSSDFSNSFLKFYPNPSSGFLSIELPRILTDGLVIISDSKGRKIISSPIREKITDFNLELEPGIYFLQIIEGNRRLATEKLIIN